MGTNIYTIYIEKFRLSDHVELTSDNHLGGGGGGGVSLKQALHTFSYSVTSSTRGMQCPGLLLS